MKQLRCRNACNLAVSSDGTVQCILTAENADECPKRDEKTTFTGDCLQ